MASSGLAMLVAAALVSSLALGAAVFQYKSRRDKLMRSRTSRDENRMESEGESFVRNMRNAQSEGEDRSPEG